VLFSPPFDVGINFLGMISSIPYALAILAGVILVEALFLDEYIEAPFTKALWYSFIINGVSTLLGIPIVIAYQTVPFFVDMGALANLDVPLFYCMPFVLTLLIEYFVLLALLKARLSKQQVLKAIIKINVISYIFLGVGTFLYMAFSTSG
jgi:hypothetical protein